MNIDAGPARVTTVAAFPVNYFLENLAVRSDDSLLVTVLNRRELWYLPSPERGPVVPVKLCDFEQAAMGIMEVEPDVFIVCTSNLWSRGVSVLRRLDLRGWTPGTEVQIEEVLQMPEAARGLNGACMVAPGVGLVADSFAGLIWRLDFGPGARRASARVWLQHESMQSRPESSMPDQPGVNGLAWATRTSHVYYTSTARQLFMRVGIDPLTQNPSGAPEFVADGIMGDDLCLDEAAGVAYIATHRQNTIDRVALVPGQPGAPRVSVAGDPFVEELLGPTSGRWARHAAAEDRHLAYFLTDGGIKAPMPDGSLRPARVLRVEFPRAMVA